MKQINNLPLISVIVPVYNVEKYLAYCLKTICKQSYTNLEIILVNDGSTDKSFEIMEEYAQNDNRIKCISHEKNRGLFQARVTGVEASTGEYIAFVDSDDSVTCDWFRLLIKKAIETRADIVIGNTICKDENKNMYIYNMYYSHNKSRECVCDADIMENFMDNEGMCFSNHTVWNKLYSREIWEKSLPYFKKITDHFVMTEDLSFSIVLHYFAKKIAFSNHDGYIYYRNSDSSTVLVNNLEKLKKNLADLQISFNFIKNFLEKQNLYVKYQEKYKQLKNRYFRWWSYLVEINTSNGSEEEKLVRKEFFEFFEKTKFERANEEDDFFTIAKTKWNDKLEKLKETIISKDINCISFDIFDTLIVRPFLEPADLFYFMDEYFKQISECNLSFKEVRIHAERICRKNIRLVNPNWQDVTLEEIYQQMKKIYGFSEKNCEQLMKKEEELEIHFCMKRTIGKELYELAHIAGKRIVLISDMYLSEKCVNQILRKNGYIFHDNIFLSSSERKLKYTGDLYQTAVEMCGIEKERILHIGDNWNVDYLKSRELGFQSCFLPKTKDILFNTLGDCYTGDSINASFNNINSVIDLSTIMSNPTVRTLYALVANESFDNPFVSFNSESNYNRDAYFIGYFVVGMHLLGITRWMTDILLKESYEKIHFIARDGYLPKKIYDITRKYVDNLPPSEYLYASRKSLVVAGIQSKIDLYNIGNNCSIYNQTPDNIYKLYASVLKPLDDEIKKRFKIEGISFDKKFKSEEEFSFFVSKLIEIAYDEKVAKINFQVCQKYFKDKIGEHDIAFDLGYSGKLQSGICRATGYPVDVLFVHTNGFGATQQSKNGGFQIKSYYDFEPPMSGIINEFIFSDYRPSCIGYVNDNDGICPIFEEKKVAFQEKYFLDEIARGCEKFIEDFYRTFQGYTEMFQLRAMDASLPYERFLMNDKPYDIDLLKNFYLEDEYYGGISKKSFSEHWRWQLGHKCIQFPKLNPMLIPENVTAQVLNPMLVSENVTTQVLNPELSLLYQDGTFVAAFRKINKYFPIGSKRRKLIKKIAHFFIK